MRYEDIKKQLQTSPKKWLITGCAGFIGSNLLEALLKLDQIVVGLDDFSTGYQHNLDEVKEQVSDQQWIKFTFVKGDIRDFNTCTETCKDIDYVLHQAALGSVPRSIDDPITTNSVNIDGFLNILVAARDARVKSFTYAASSSTYGDQRDLPKVEDKIGNPLSPYAVTKYVNELYADVFARTYDFKSIGLRYFNVFGKRQDPEGAYAAVIPKWVSAMIKNEDVFINGDGETSRDFCFIDNAVQANIMAATATEDAMGHVYNVACNQRTSLNELFSLIKEDLGKNGVIYSKKPRYQNFRAGDVRHSLADISKAGRLLGYMPEYKIVVGLSKAMPWYMSFLEKLK